MGKKLKLVNHWAWLIIQTIWTGILVGAIANILSSEGMLRWVNQNIIMVLIIFAVFIIITLAIGLVDRIDITQGGIKPWIKWTWVKYVAMVVLLVIAVISLFISISPTSLAITMIPLGTVAAILLVILLIIEFVALMKSTSSTTSSANKMFQRREFLSLVIGSAVGASMLALPITRLNALLELLFPKKPPVIITILSTTGKREWLNNAKDKFNRSQKGVRVIVDEGGSMDAVGQILSGEYARPTVWSPASALELHLLSTKWKQKYPGSQDIITYTGELAPQSLVHTPLVFAIWQSRAQVLSTSPYHIIDWPNIHQLLLLHNWSEVNGDSSWGEVKFAHTQPDLTNNGLLTLALLAYSYFNKESGLTTEDVANPQFQKYFKEIEDKVRCFGPSGGTFTDTVIQQGPNAFDIITTSEKEVLAKEQEAMRRWEPIYMFYPRLETIADHPFAILHGDWVKPEQQDAAREFLDFLLHEDQQKSALTFGYRSYREKVHITDPIPGNRFREQPPFLQKQIKSEADLKPLAQVPTGEVVDSLIALWRSQKYAGRECL